MPRPACLRCAELRASAARCPRCQHPLVDLDGERGQRALHAAIRRKKMGFRLFSGAVAVLAGAVAVSAQGLDALAKPLLIVGTPVLLLSFVFGLNAHPLIALRRPDPPRDRPPPAS